MLPQRLILIVLKANKDSSMASPRSGPVLNLVQDEFETEQTHLKYPVV